jgi:hypothetical protein
MNLLKKEKGCGGAFTIQSLRKLMAPQLHLKPTKEGLVVSLASVNIIGVRDA